MGRTVSGEKARAAQHEFAYNRNNRLLEFLAQGKRVVKDGASKVISVKESLISKTTNQARHLALCEKFEKEFSKCAGTYADTKKIFSKVILRNKRKEEVAAL